MTILLPNAAILAPLFYLVHGLNQWPEPTPATRGAGRVAAPDAVITVPVMVIFILQARSSTADMWFLFVPVYAAGVAGCCHAIPWSPPQMHVVASARRQGSPRPPLRQCITAALMLSATTALLAMFPRSELLAGLADYRANWQLAGNVSAPPEALEILARAPDDGIAPSAWNEPDRLEYSGQRQ